MSFRDASTPNCEQVSLKFRQATQGVRTNVAALAGNAWGGSRQYHTGNNCREQNSP